MVARWEPGTQYNYGDIVQYEDHRYKIIQPHFSQSDWTPPQTPALWGRLQDDDRGFGSGQYCPPPHHEANPPNYGYGQDGKNEQPVYQPHPEQNVPVPHEEAKKHWYDIDDGRKKELEVGGALLAGAAAIGAGYFAYREHNKNEEEKKALTWGLQSWLAEAQKRKDDFYNNGPRAPTTWILTQNHDIPRGALPGGHDDSGQVLFIARAFHEGGVHVGYASPRTKKGAVISFAGDDIDLNMYEVLLGDERGVHWEHLRGRFNQQNLYNPPVEGGREADGTPLAIARVEHSGWKIPGKASTGLDGADYAYHGKEKIAADYEVLCYNKAGGY